MIWFQVNLKQPDVTFAVDIYSNGIYLYAEKIRASGGFPVGSAGHVLSLLSGGIDSPVAAYYLARRGCSIDLFHMAASHVQLQDIDQSLIARLACRLSHYTLRSRLYIVPYTHFDLALLDQQTRYGLILLRRFMTRTAAVLAQGVNAAALVAGDSLGQVASQTLENLVTNSAAVPMPILQPLIGFNKQEIIAVARMIGTYKLSTEPYKDCCALIGQNPKTRSYPDQLQRLEARLLPEYRQLIAATLADTVCLQYDCGELIRAPQMFRRWATDALAATTVE